jgi:hypothetical protein
MESFRLHGGREERSWGGHYGFHVAEQQGGGGRGGNGFHGGREEGSVEGQMWDGFDPGRHGSDGQRMERDRGELRRYRDREEGSREDGRYGGYSVAVRRGPGAERMEEVWRYGDRPDEVAARFSQCSSESDPCILTSH